MHKPNRETAALVAEDARLLTMKEMRKLFPDAETLAERLFFFPRSYIVMRRTSAEL